MEKLNNKQFKIKSLVFIFGLLFISISAKGQEMFGISNSNFAGNMGMGLNPSLFVGSPYLQEFNIISGDLFVDNDYVYLKRRSSLLSKSIQGETVPEENVLDFYDGKTKSAYSNVFLRGPSFIKNGDKFSWGVHSALRFNLSATDVPIHVAKFLKEGFDYIPQHDQQFQSTPFKSASMSWMEIGGTFGRVIKEERNKKYLAGAVTLKFLVGLNAAYTNLSTFDYFVPSADTLVVNNATGEYGHALSDMEGEPAKPFSFRGYGGAIDLGITYYRGKVHGAGDCNQTAEKLKKYKYRLGVSLIDVGFVMFRKQAKTFAFDNASMVWPGINEVNFNSIHDLDTSISYQFYGDGEASYSSDKFDIYLPTAFSMQFDYCIIARVYANATIIQAVPLSKNAIVRASQIAITPRYETRNFEASLPFTFYEYKTPHLGLAFRYKFIVIGTDRLGSFTGLWDTTGYDLYFGLKFNTCELRKKGGKQPFCPVN